MIKILQPDMWTELNVVPKLFASKITSWYNGHGMIDVIQLLTD